MSFETWITFVFASSALLLVPGPAMIFMFGLALNQGLTKALLALPGLMLGLAASITFSLLGAGVVLLASAELFAALKFLGAAYLVYLGVQLWSSDPTGLGGEQLGSAKQKSLFWPAFLIALLNPKGLVFFIAFLPQFIDKTSTPLPQFLVLGSTFSIIALAAAVASALAGNGLRQRARSRIALQILNKFGGGFLVSAGIFAASSARE